MKIWYKVLKQDKIINSAILEFDQPLNEENFLIQLREVCYKMDVPTPIILKNHFPHFTRFNILHFKPDDFVEKVDFDKLDVEFVREKKISNKKFI